jgi:hypothetical protein
MKLLPGISPRFGGSYIGLFVPAMALLSCYTGGYVRPCACGFRRYEIDYGSCFGWGPRAAAG